MAEWISHARWARAAGCALVGQALVGMAGCSSIHIQNAEVVEKIYPGFVVLSLTPRPHVAAIVRSRGIGLVIGVTGTTLGFLDESAFISFDPQACRLFIAVETEAQADAVVRALGGDGQTKDLCVVKKPGEKR